MPTAKLSVIETRIQKLYDKFNIHYPQDIDLDRICDNLGIRVLYGAVRSQSFLDSKIIFVDDRLPLNEQREEFAHELVHIWLHSGSQLVLPEPFIRAQESQADRTAMYLLVPTRFLERELDQVDHEKGLISYLAETFRIRVSTMARRWQLYLSTLEVQALGV